MSDLSPEMEFLQSLKGESTNAADPQVPIQDVDDDDEDDYDPSSFVTASKPTVESTTSASSAQRPASTASKSSRFKAGFEIDEDDDDDDDNENGVAHLSSGSGANGLMSGNMASGAKRSSSETPANVQSIRSPDVSIQNTTVKSVQENRAPNVSVPSYLDPRASSTPTPQPNLSSASALGILTEENPNASSSFFQKARLPQDRVGILEDRITEDPRGDVDAWLELIAEHRSRNRFDQAREVYQRFFKLFPTAVNPLVSYAKMEQELDEVVRLEKIFQDHLLNVPDVQLWSMYLNHVRRTQNLTTDTTGTARKTITQAYNIVLDTIGCDKDSGMIWRDYIQFLQSAPGAVGGTTWEDGQKMDSLRKAYRQAVVVPTKELQSLWRDYHTFEHSLSQLTARKFLNEHSAAFMDAKQAWVQLQNITEKLNRSSVPRLPPVPGFEGDTEHQEQMEIWRQWIAWEKNDPLALKKDEPKEYEKRVNHVYKQATIWMRFEPEFWYDAAEYCFMNNMNDKGDEFIVKGIAANPESCLLAFRRADRLEMAPSDSGGQDSAVKRGSTVREPYDKVLNALYDLIDITKSRNEKSIARIQDSHAHRLAQLDSNYVENEEEQERARKALETEQETQIKAIQTAGNTQEDLLKRTISYAWIALMRAMRRIQGKGKPADTNAPGMRGIFTEARKRGRLLSDFYGATAWMEHHCYKEPAAGKIFHRGSTLFPDDERFALEHIKYLITVQDPTNARVAFATIVHRLTQKPETVHRTKRLYLFFHEFESKYGELSQVAALEKKMLELFPEDPQLFYFAHRFEQGEPGDKFDPTRVRPIISVVAQMRPKLPSAPIVYTPSLNNDLPATFSPRPSVSPRPAMAIPDLLARNSPKRPFIADSGDESHLSRKIPRVESPLKGAAGRRLDAVRRRAEGSAQHAQLAPPPLPADVNFFLLALPRTELSINVARTNIPALMSALASAKLDSSGITKSGGYSNPPAPMSYGYPPR